MMQVVSIKWIFFGLFIFFTSKGISQEIIPTNNKGGYTLNYTAQEGINKKESIIIFGVVYDVKSLELIQASKIRFLCKDAKTNEKGEYKIVVEKSNFEYNQLVVKAIGYKTVKTNIFKIKESSIQINFYLEEEDMPFIDCN